MSPACWQAFRTVCHALWAHAVDACGMALPANPHLVETIQIFIHRSLPGAGINMHSFFSSRYWY